MVLVLTEAAIVNIWVRLLNTLKRDILNAGKTSTTEAEDINVEHAQLLLFLFHTLPLMQKKSLLLQLAQVWRKEIVVIRLLLHTSGPFGSSLCPPLLIHLSFCPFVSLSTCQPASVYQPASLLLSGCPFWRFDTVLRPTEFQRYDCIPT